MTRLGVLLAAVPALASAPSPAQVAPAPDPKDVKPSVTVASSSSNPSVFSFDYGVPTSPSLALAGLSTDKATVNSSSLKPFVFSLPAVLSGTGGQSAALDFAPAALFVGPSRQIFEQYTDPAKWLYRLSFRSRLNAAIYNGVDGNGDKSKNKSSRLAFGASISLLDSSDPLMSSTPASRADGKTAWRQCIDQVPVGVGPDQSPAGDASSLGALIRLQGDVEMHAGTTPRQFATPAKVAEISAALGEPVSIDGMTDTEIAAMLGKLSQKLQDKADAAAKVANKVVSTSADSVAFSTGAKHCAEVATDAALYAPAVNLGAGTLLRGDPGHLRGFGAAGTVEWASARYPLFDIRGKDGMTAGYLMLAAYARLSQGEYVATGDKTTPEIKADVQDYWVGSEFYSRHYKLAAQVGWTKTRADEPAGAPFSRHGLRWLASGSIPIAGEDAGVWLGFSYGNARGTLDTLNGHTFLLTLDLAPPKPADILGLAKH